MYGCYYQINVMTSIKKELAEYGLIPKKGLGQHFLIDRNILNKVIRTAGIEKEDVVLEVGPGLGEMTLALARQAKRVMAIEIDPKLVAILKKKRVRAAVVPLLLLADDCRVDRQRRHGPRTRVDASLTPSPFSTTD